MENTNSSYFVFREVQTHNELLELLRLRYAVYRDCRLEGFCPENKHGLDIDAYDARSRHFGLYSVNGNNAQELIGGIRVVEQSQTSAKRHLQLLASYYPIIRDALAKPIREQFPLLTYDSEEKEAVRRAITGFTRNGERIVEPGRLLLRPQHRSLVMAKRIVESAIIVYFLSAQSVDRAVLSCASTQRCFYRRYGFDLVDGTSGFYCPLLGGNASCLQATPGNVPLSRRSRLKLVADKFDRSGRIVYRAGQQSQVVHTDRVAAVA